MDPLSPEERSALMGRVRGKDTKPELAVRRLIHAMGYRYRLRLNTLPGRPDLVFSGRRKVIFVHGCFWHRHEGCPNTRTPKSKREFWIRKFMENKERDQRQQRELREMGWDYLVIWECQVKNLDMLASRVKTFLEELT